MVVVIIYLQEIIFIKMLCNDFRKLPVIFQGRLVDAGNLYETRSEYGSREMRRKGMEQFLRQSVQGAPT